MGFFNRLDAIRGDENLVKLQTTKADPLARVRLRHSCDLQIEGLLLGGISKVHGVQEPNGAASNDLCH